jgi:dihydroflavonol-4-reductase
MAHPTLVTGATGLLGNNVVRQLLEANEPVRVLVREQSSPRPLEGLDVERVVGDVCDAESIDQACADTNCVIHCAGFVQLGRGYLEKHRAVNVEGARNVAQAARRLGIRMVHVSTVDALGVRSVKQPADEDTLPTMPACCNYARTKREAEQVVLEEVAEGLDAVIVNPGFMLGPWDWAPSSGQMLLEVARGRGILAPRGWYSVCDARDVATATLAARSKGQKARRYILAGENLTYLAAWRLFADVTGARKPLGYAGPLMSGLAGRAGDFWAMLTGHEPNVNSGAVALARLPKAYSSRRAETELGYHCRPFRESTQDAWDWFQEYGFV